MILESMESTMKDKSSRRSLLRLFILILIMHQTIILATHHGSHQRVSRKIHLPRAMEATKIFLCKDPQSRSYNVRDLVQDMQSSESPNRPVYIVLKRCDSHSGCCISPDLSCAPVQSSIYHEEMEVEVWSLLTNSTRRTWIRVEQHGRCSCEISSSSDRFKADTQPPAIEIL